MIAGQKLVANDGYEVALFPMPVLHMTQDEGGDYSHLGTYNIDIVGATSQAPIYAPCTVKVVAVSLTEAWGNTVYFESVNPVHLPNGQLDYLTISFAHDSNPPVTTIGQVVQQGDLCYRTGTYGWVTGDHTHTCCGQGHYQGVTQRSSGNWDLVNRIHYWEGVFVNDTTIIQGYGHDWRTWDEPVTPPKVWGEKRSKHFPFPIAWNSWGYRR